MIQLINYFNKEKKCLKKSLKEIKKYRDKKMKENVQKNIYNKEQKLKIKANKI